MVKVENLWFSSVFNRFLFYPRFLTRRTLVRLTLVSRGFLLQIRTPHRAIASYRIWAQAKMTDKNKKAHFFINELKYNVQGWNSANFSIKLMSFSISVFALSTYLYTPSGRRAKIFAPTPCPLNVCEGSSSFATWATLFFQRFNRRAKPDQLESKLRRL